MLTLDYTGFPHIFRQIVAESDFHTQLVLRLLSTAAQEDVDRAYCEHVCVLGSGSSRLVIVLDGPPSRRERARSIGPWCGVYWSFRRAPLNFGVVNEMGVLQRLFRQPHRAAISAVRSALTLHVLPFNLKNDADLLRLVRPAATVTVHVSYGFCEPQWLQRYPLPSAQKLKVYVSDCFMGDATVVHPQPSPLSLELISRERGRGTTCGFVLSLVTPQVEHLTLRYACLQLAADLLHAVPHTHPNLKIRLVLSSGQCSRMGMQTLQKFQDAWAWKAEIAVQIDNTADELHDAGAKQPPTYVRIVHQRPTSGFDVALASHPWGTSQPVPKFEKFADHERGR